MKHVYYAEGFNVTSVIDLDFSNQQPYLDIESYKGHYKKSGMN